MTGLGYLALDILGSGPWVFGAAITQVGSTDVFSAAPGRIYQLEEIETTAWSSLPVNTSQILKQGISLQAVNFACPAPSVSGQSINYLLECQYQDFDTNFRTLSYYNAANPSQPFSGAGNNGLAQPTTRTGLFTIFQVPGTAANTGSQTTPATTSGWYPLAVVTATYGGTYSVATPSGAPYVPSTYSFAQLSTLTVSSGQFTTTLGGVTSSSTGTVNWSRVGNIATVNMPVGAAGTGSNTSLSFITSMPSAIIPAHIQIVPCSSTCFEDNSVVAGFAVDVQISPSTGNVNFYKNGSTSGWTAAGAKGISNGMSFTYPLL